MSPQRTFPSSTTRRAHRSLPGQLLQRHRVHPRMPPAGLPYAAADLAQPEGRKLAAREHRRNLLHARRAEAVEAGRRAAGRELSWRARRASTASSRWTTSTWRRPPRLREHLRVAGMGDTTARYFRDKLAMRSQGARRRAAGAGVHSCAEPRAAARLHGARAAAVGAEAALAWPAPWASRKFTVPMSSGRALEQLGDQQSFYLLEQYVPGDIYHVDSIFYERELLFCHRQPLRTAADGRLAAGRHLHHPHVAAGFAGSAAADRDESQQVMKAFGHGARRLAQRIHSRARRRQAVLSGDLGARGRSAHRRSDRSRDRHQHVGGMGEGRNRRRQSAVPAARAAKDSAGLLVSLARQEHPDTSAYNDPEIVWRMDEKKHHVGLIVKSSDAAAGAGIAPKLRRSGCGKISWHRSRRWRNRISESASIPCFSFCQTCRKGRRARSPPAIVESAEFQLLPKQFQFGVISQTLPQP